MNFDPFKELNDFKQIMDPSTPFFTPGSNPPLFDKLYYSPAMSCKAELTPSSFLLPLTRSPPCGASSSRFSQRRLELHLSTEETESDNEGINQDLRDSWRHQTKDGSVASPPRSDVHITVFHLSGDGDRDAENASKDASSSRTNLSARVSQPSQNSQTSQTFKSSQSSQSSQTSQTAMGGTGAARKRAQEAGRIDESDASSDGDASFQENESDDEALHSRYAVAARPRTHSRPNSRPNSKPNSKLSSKPNAKPNAKSNSKPNSKLKRFSGMDAANSAPKTPRLGGSDRGLKGPEESPTRVGPNPDASPSDSASSVSTFL